MDTTSQQELPFPGFKALVETPLCKSDPVSFERIKSIFIQHTTPPADPFRILLQSLSGKIFYGNEAKKYWQHIIAHKEDMGAKLGRPVGIQVSVTDYFDIIATKMRSDSKSTHSQSIPMASDDINREEWLNRIYSPGYHLEKLKEELLRAKRYKHSLSAILLDLDNFDKINQMFTVLAGDEALVLVVKIIKKTIRAVDILTRHSGDRFFIILPNTNKREAGELAQRLCKNIATRTSRIESMSGGITATLAVGQSSKDAQSVEFVRSLERTLEEGKKSKRNAVYMCETC